jgi:ABC-type glycerol-3-phosphate transport system substrate-binding protein
MMRPVRSVPLAIVALLGLVACSAGALAFCASAGGTYAAGTCTRWSAEQEAAEQLCQARAGVYLTGQDTCVVGAGLNDRA